MSAPQIANLEAFRQRFTGNVVLPGSEEYEKARALQDFFRTNFTYSLSPPPGHDVGAMEHFLFDLDSRCEVSPE